MSEAVSLKFSLQHSFLNEQPKQMFCCNLAKMRLISGFITLSSLALTFVTISETSLTVCAAR